MTMELTDTTGMPAPAAAQLAAVRTELEQQRRFRVEQLEEAEVDAAEALAAADDARLQVIRSLFITTEAALREINVALARLDHGTYGTCEHCHQPIPIERLEVLPTSRSCTPCQARADIARVRRGGHSRRPVAGPASRAASAPSQ
ncbi:TraR/DksA C4-type zinc finger protein [Microlunatus aurantiacus]